MIGVQETQCLTRCVPRWCSVEYDGNGNALAEAKAFDLALVGDNYQGRYNKSKKTLATYDDFVNQYGRASCLLKISKRLTNTPLAFILAPLSQHVAVWGESHKNQQMPVARLIHRLRFHMQKIIYGGRYLGSFGSHGSVAMSLDPDNVHRPIFERIKRCPQPFSRGHTMSQNNSVQTEQNQAPQAVAELGALTPDFKHRLCYKRDDFAPATPQGLALAVEMIVERAIGVLTMVQGEFTGEDRGRTCDKAIFYSLESVEKDLMDVMSLSREFVAKHQAGHKSNGGAL